MANISLLNLIFSDNLAYAKIKHKNMHNINNNVVHNILFNKKIRTKYYLYTKYSRFIVVFYRALS